MSDSTEQAEWVRPRPDPIGYRRDILLAALVLIGTALSIVLHAIAGYYDEPAPLWVSALCAVGLSAPIAVRRRYPAAVVLAVSVVVIVLVTLRVPELVMFNITLFIAIYTVGAWGRDRGRATVVRSVVVIGMFVWLFIVLVSQLADPPPIPGVPDGVVSPALIAIAGVQIFTNLLYFAGAWYFGDRAWAAARQRAVLEDRTVELARQREVSASQAIALERVRIARELHDVVAHHVSVMGVQAGAARRVLATDPTKATSSLASIEASARTAVEEMHLLLTTLRSADADASETDASPSFSGVEQIHDLVAEVERAGMSVRHSVVGDIRPVPATTSVTSYRVAQEALTNIVKHAGPAATADLRVRYVDGAIEIEVADDGRGTGRGSGTSTGLGLVGMRERVIAVGGELQVGTRSRGGFLVRATLPTTTTARPADAAERAQPGATAASASTSLLTDADAGADADEVRA